jgi:DnaK suppressor protein
MTLKQKKLNSFKEELLVRREQIVSDLRLSTVEFLDNEPNFSDSIDQASAETARNLTLKIKNRERDDLWQIEDALRRIEAGTFGECERCGDDISEARIRARCSATLCIQCQSEAEMEDSRLQAYRF